MEQDIAIIADEDTVLGFQLAGVKAAAVYNPGEPLDHETIEKLGAAKILILTEKVAEQFRKEGVMKKISAVIAEIPDKSGSTGTALQHIGHLLEEAIGVRLKE